MNLFNHLYSLIGIIIKLYSIYIYICYNMVISGLCKCHKSHNTQPSWQEETGKTQSEDAQVEQQAVEKQVIQKYETYTTEVNETKWDINPELRQENVWK